MALHKPFDVSLKDLMEERPQGWPVLAGGWHPRRIELIDADVATLTAAADKVFRLEDDSGTWLLDLEPEASFKPDTPDKLHLYSAALSRRHRLLVRTVILLLRREADGPHLSGVLRKRFVDESEDYDVFRYRVVRLWELPVETLLTGDVGLLPLAPLADEAVAHAEEVIQRVNQRIRDETPPELGDKLRVASAILMGLRYPPAQIEEYWSHAMQMQESPMYQFIMDKGAVRHTRDLLLKLGQDRFGPPNPAARSAVEAMTELAHLDTLIGQVHSVGSWEELLVTPTP